MEEEIKNINPELNKLVEIDTSVFKDSGFFKLGFRKKEFLESAIILGRERDIIFPSGEKNRSYFAIVDMDNILASHNEETFASTKGYPTNENGRNINDRNYEKDKNAQARVMSVAQKLNPNIIISTNATSSGTPIVTLDGIVVSGNNRTMSVKRAKNSFEAVYQNYKNILRDELIAGGYGIAKTKTGYNRESYIKKVLDGEELLIKSGDIITVGKTVYTLSELENALEDDKDYKVQSLKVNRSRRGGYYDVQESYNWWLRGYADSEDYKDKKILNKKEILEQIRKDIDNRTITKSSDFRYAESGSMKDIKMSIKNPILVRINVDFPEYTTAELNKYNKTTKKSERQIDVALRLSEQLKSNESCKNSLIELISDLEVVSELYNKPDYVSKYKKILLNCEIITENDLAGLFVDRTFTDAGKLQYEIILLSLVLDAKSIEISQNSGVKSFTNKVVNAIIPLIRNKSLEKGSLIDEVNNAMLIKNDLVNKKYNSLAQYVTENPLFEDTDEHKTEKAIIITYFIEGKRDDFKNALKSYNNSMSENQGADMFGDALSPDEIFNLIFMNNADETILKALNMRDKEEKIDVLLQVSEEKEKLAPIEVVEEIVEKKKEMSPIMLKALKYI